MKKHSLKRLDLNYSESSDGQTFVSSNGQIIDLSDFRLLDTSIDTLRQLFSGRCNEGLFNMWCSSLEVDQAPVIEYQGHMWRLRRGGQSGYKLMLQNVELGLVIHYKSNYAKPDSEHSHCKIEVSPKVLRDQSAEAIDNMLLEIATGLFTARAQPCGVAIHIAADFQGWTPEKDFVPSITCRSRRVTDHTGISDLNLQTGSTVCAYARGESFLFGKATHLQFAFYNKSLEIKAHDKIDYFQGIWKNKLEADLLTPIWKPEQDVWRAEFRFSHTVIKQFAAYNQTQLNSYSDVVKVLANLWQYALDSYRYDLDAKHVHPLWTLLSEDAKWYPPSTSFIAKRQYKTPGIGNERNVALAFGNLLSIYARNNITANTAWKFLKKSGLWADLITYCKARDISKAELYQVMEKRLLERRLTSKQAA